MRKGEERESELCWRSLVELPATHLHAYATQTHKGAFTVHLQICTDTKTLVASEYFLVHKNHINIDCLNILFSRGFI